ncbi:MAG TPA: 23S rRNA (pseudouridine(1915)-N(3))-methyltransferase RlmH [Bacteroidales bacterium]|nr:23S rRNA (pseudouridine(1915)-N(3))-methyltransferase RlmH [Bacteroidales bacterium]HPT51949.1 23S rRNA (pseudouridine(1915)-N(3))-methyltransferase RlmH [Bacteroidales bacterium]
MKAKLIFIGKEDAETLQPAIMGYVTKIKFYIPFETDAIPYLKNTKLSVEEQKKQEGLLFLKKIDTSDFVVLLDEHGKELSSIDLSQFMQQQMIRGTKRVVFLIGGPYGFSDEVYQRANYQIALSRMTFPHILTRLIFAEQLYRAMTIWKGEPYHHS